MTNKITSLQFLLNEADEDEGLGHAGIETYKDAPYAGVARECGQNSRDAAATLPVVVKFDLVHINHTDLPDYSKLCTTVSACLDRALERDDEKEFDFFTRAEQVLGDSNIRVLRIQDFNTRGLRGPSEPGTPFHSLVKSTGVSKKESDTSGGSFGIGKNAAFSVSEMQTVYYSTLYQNEEGGTQFLAQGKSILVSHRDKEGISRRATGYWGCDHFQPVSNPDNVPGWLLREEVGTSVYAIGFREAGNWDFRMAASLIQNFFCAIHRGEMAFEINEGSIIINTETLPVLFNDDRMLAAAIDSNRKEDFDFSRNLYECLISTDAVEKIFEIKGLGSVSVRILVKDGMPKRLSIVRNGMSITDTLENFGDKFRSFPMYSEFVAIVETQEQDGSRLIKKLENPKHDGLSAERISDETKRKNAERIMKSFARKLREVIREQTLSKPEDQVALDELSEFFADEDQSDRLQDPDATENPETFTYTPVSVRKKRVETSKVKDDGSEGGAGVDGGKSGGEGGGRGTGAGSGSGGKGTTGHNKAINLTGFRNLIPQNDVCKRKLFFTPTESCSGEIRVLASGVNNSEDLSVQSASTGAVNKGKIKLEMEKNVRTELEVSFAAAYDGPIELIAERLATDGDNNESQ